MLVLSRRVGERICVGDGIFITVVGVRGKQVQIGVEAPRHVRVLREELLAGEGPAADVPVLANREPPRLGAALPPALMCER